MPRTSNGITSWLPTRIGQSYSVSTSGAVNVSGWPGTGSRPVDTWRQPLNGLTVTVTGRPRRPATCMKTPVGQMKARASSR